GPVELEAVVGLRIVRRGDLHARGRLEIAHREGHFGGAAHPVEAERADAVCGEDLAAHPSELDRSLARLVADHHATLAGCLAADVDELAQRLGSLADGPSVDAVRSRTDGAADPAGADVDVLVKSVLELSP